MALVMGKLSEYQDEMAQKQVQRLSALFEPLIIVVMGVIIGFIAISLMLPLFRMSSVISRGG
jgi:type II secretory pathway component PulF